MEEGTQRVTGRAKVARSGSCILSRAEMDAKWEDVKAKYVLEGYRIKDLAVMFNLKETTIGMRIKRFGWKKERDEIKLKSEIADRIEIDKRRGFGDRGQILTKEVRKEDTIRVMTEVANDLLEKLRLRVRGMASTEDKELERATGTLKDILEMLSQLLGIGKGEGQQVVERDRIQVNILQQVVEKTDEAVERGEIRVGEIGPAE